MADFQKSYDTFRAAEIDVIAASVDDLTDTRKMIDAEHLTFPVGYGLDAQDTARLLGSFYEDDPESDFLHPADFIIRPDGTIESATYSTGPVGRLAAADALALIEYRRKRS